MTEDPDQVKLIFKNIELSFAAGRRLPSSAGIPPRRVGAVAEHSFLSSV